MSNASISYLNIGLAFCCVLWLTPPYKRIKHYPKYAVIMMTLWLIAIIYSVHGKIFPRAGQNKFVILQSLEISKIIFSWIVCLVATIKFIFMCPYVINNIINSMADFDDQIPSLHHKMKNHFWIGFILSNIITLTFILLKRVYWLLNPYYRYYYEEDFTYYRIDAGMFLYFWLALEIRQRFLGLNKSLKEVCDGLQDEIFFSGHPVKILSFKMNTLRQLIGISKLHNDLCDILHHFNETFGFFIMFYILFASTFIVEGMMITIWYSSFHITSLAWMENSSLVWIYCYAIAEVFARVLAIAAVGTYLRKEASKTTAICYKSIHSLRHNESCRAQVLTEELRHLADQVEHRKPFLSAAGFFVIDFTIMGSIAYSITSYIIVALQFLRDD